MLLPTKHERNNMFCYFHDPESIIYSESPFDHIDFYVHVEIYQTQIICACMSSIKLTCSRIGLNIAGGTYEHSSRHRGGGC
jgi:hypothetical protein